MQFLLLHGSYGSTEENWLPALREELEALGQKVVVPQFPVDQWDEVTKAGEKTPTKHQNLINWLRTFEVVVGQLEPGERTCVVAHSLGPLFLLHAMDKFPLILDSAILVCPFLTKLNKTWQIDAANATFYKDDFKFEKLRPRLGKTYVIYSDNDPYVKNEYSLEFAKKLNSSVIEVRGGGHLSSKSGYLDFPLVFDLCETRIGNK